jgi:hypothetical protein
MSVDIGAFLFLSLSFSILLALLILRARKGPLPETRPLPALQDLRDKMKKAAERGGVFHIALGSGGLGGEDTVTSLAGLQAVEALADAAVAYEVPPVVTVGDPTLLPLVQDVLRRVYERRGLEAMYRSSQARFVAPSPLAYAVGAANVVAADEAVVTNVMVGNFGAEVSLIADAGARRGLPQLAAAAAPDAIGALYPATDRLAVGEELYVIGAYASKERHYQISLIAQDILRVLLVLFILGVAGLALLRSLGILG